MGPDLAFQHESACNVDGSQFCTVTIVVPAVHINNLYKKALTCQQKGACAPGFKDGCAPLEYIAERYQTSLLEHVKEFLFNYLVISFLYERAREQRLLFAGEPRLADIDITLGQDAFFKFEGTIIGDCALRGWRHYPFRAPKRKNYRDLDRQVDLFLQEELKLTEKHAGNPIEIDDWICFSAALLDDDGTSLFGDHAQFAWLKIGNEEADKPFAELFVGKRPGDSFVTNAACMQEYFSRHIDTDYQFRITVDNAVPHCFVCLESFKHAFKLRTNREMHRKLIEVFSYRHDISQRRETVQEAFRVLLARHLIEPPEYLVLRRQEVLLKLIRKNPDFPVYKMDHQFSHNLRQLAHRQVQESILMDQLSIRENINATNQDIIDYLNLTKRPRLKEFIYFTLPSTRINGCEMPIPAAVLKRYCLLEKTLNHAIHTFTQR